MCIEKICTASTLNGRCTNFTLDKKCDHCIVHNETAVKLYLEYKEICKIADSKNINAKIKDPLKYMKYLHNCHIWLVKAYNARLRHRIYAYVPETVDYGHLEQYRILKQKIDLCQAKILEVNKLINKKVPNNIIEEDSEEDLESSVEDSPENPIIYEVREFQKKQKSDDAEFDKILQKNIKENEQIAKEKNKAVTLCMNLIKARIDPKYNNYFVQIGIFRTLVQMQNMDYFHPLYMPQPCENCSCGGYKPIQFKLGCPCFLEEAGDSVSFLNRCTIAIDHLKMMCEIILYFPKKVYPMIKEFTECYKIHDNNLIKKLMMFVWEEDKNRLVLSYDGFVAGKKPSERISRMRQKLNSKSKITEIKLTWGDTLDILSHFIERNGKLPPANSKNSTTQMLNKWLTQQRKDYESNCMTEHESSFEKFLCKHSEYFF